MGRTGRLSLLLLAAASLVSVTVDYALRELGNGQPTRTRRQPSLPPQPALEPAPAPTPEAGSEPVGGSPGPETVRASPGPEPDQAVAQAD